MNKIKRHDNGSVVAGGSQTLVSVQPPSAQINSSFEVTFDPFDSSNGYGPWDVEAQGVVSCSIAGPFYAAGFPGIKFNAGYDDVWYEDPVWYAPYNVCAWNPVTEPTAPDCLLSGVAISDIFYPLTYKCWDSQNPFYKSVLDAVPWVEVQIGGRVYGAGFPDSRYDKKSGWPTPAQACTAIPAHLGIWP